MMVTRHHTALVPAEAWAYNSPDVRAAGKSVDIGLIAEALLYYDSIAVSVGNHLQFIEFLEWFISQGKFSELIDLVSSGVLTFYDYSFMTSAILSEKGFVLGNLQDPVQAQAGSFPQRYLYRPELRQLLRHARQRQSLFRAMENRVIEVKADDFGPAVENARADVRDARRHAIVLQAFVDELYSIRGLGRPPQIEAAVNPSADGELHHITWNVDLDSLAEAAGEIGFHRATPLIALAQCNRQLLSAARQGWDLYLGRPMATLAGDKLYESLGRPEEIGAIIKQLKVAVEFPDLRRLVNEGTISISDVLMIRKKAAKFRSWLQSESDRDRDALIAYHNEVAKETGLLRLGRKTLNLFGILGGGALGSAIGSALVGPVGGAVGGVAGSSLTALMELTSKLGTDWKPIVFGNWYSSRIERLAAEQKSSSVPHQQ